MLSTETIEVIRNLLEIRVKDDEGCTCEEHINNPDVPCIHARQERQALVEFNTIYPKV